MESVLGGRAVIKAVKKTGGIAVVMQRDEFGRIQKAVRALEIKCRKIAELGTTESQICLFLICAKIAEGRIKAAGRLLLIQARAGNGVDHETRLIAVLGRRGSRDNL